MNYAETFKNDVSFAASRSRSVKQQTRVTKYKFWYDTIIDWMLLNPQKPLTVCAKDLGRGYTTITSIANSDMFKARFAQRRQDFNQQLAEDIQHAAGGVALAAMNEIADRIKNNSAKIPFAQLTDVGAKTMAALGYGAPPIQQPAQVNVQTTTNVMVSPSALSDAQALMRKVQGQNAAATIDVTPVPQIEKWDGDVPPLKGLLKDVTPRTDTGK